MRSQCPPRPYPRAKASLSPSSNRYRSASTINRFAKCKTWGTSHPPYPLRRCSASRRSSSTWKCANRRSRSGKYPVARKACSTWTWSRSALKRPSHSRNSQLEAPPTSERKSMSSSKRGIRWWGTRRRNMETKRWSMVRVRKMMKFRKMIMIMTVKMGNHRVSHNNNNNRCQATILPPKPIWEAWPQCSALWQSRG